MNPAEAVFILARSSEDWIPSPRLPEPMAAAAKARPTNTDPDSHAATELVPCGTCGGRGRTLATGRPCHACPSQTKPGKDRPPGWRELRRKRAQHGCLPCPGCEGSGWRERREGETPVDPYTLERLPLGAGEAAPMTLARELEEIRHQLRTGELRYAEMWELDAAIRKTERLLALSEGRFDLEEFGWERIKKLYWRTGDYALLEWAHRRLEAERPMAWSTWRRFVVGRDDSEVQSERIRERLDETAGLLAGWMVARRRAMLEAVTRREQRAVELRVPPWLVPEREAEGRKPMLWRGRSEQHRQARDERDALILGMLADGAEPGEVAGRFALSSRRVQQILAESGGAVASGPAA